MWTLEKNTFIIEAYSRSGQKTDNTHFAATNLFFFERWFFFGSQNLILLYLVSDKKVDIFWVVSKDL